MAGDEQFQRLDALLDAALDLDTEARAAFLEQQCGGDPALRERIERLLRDAEADTGELSTGGGLRAFPGLAGPAAVDLTGTTVDRYRLERELARGGMGIVYEAHDDRLDRAVAVKVLTASGLDGDVRERFLREARAAAALNHPNIVAVHDAGESEGVAYLVMELVPGHSLDERPPRSVAEGIQVAIEICRALEHAHERGLIHRDLKPGNVLIHRDGDRPIVKLTDMGIALTRGAPRITGTGAVAGTPAFMSPEQAMGRAVDARTDLYSLGVMLYQWSTGRLPFDGDDALAVVSQHIHAPVVPPRALRDDLPGGLEAVILALLAKRPEDRSASATDVRIALEAVGGDEPTVRAVTLEGLTRGRLIGRQAELDELQRLWREAASGRGRLALISGEPGIGKTRLAREVSAGAQLAGALELTGACYENEATTPYLPFREAFRRFAREHDDTALAAALGDAAAEIAMLTPDVAARLGPFPDRPRLGSQEERLRLFDGVATFVRRIAQRRGLLMFFDDLQWADQGTVDLLRYLLRESGDMRTLFLGTYREVELDRTHALSRALADWARERVATRIRLERLPQDETARMIATLLATDDVPDDLARVLHEETEGNPFFIEEVVKALIAEGDLVRTGMRWVHCSGEFVLPQSVKSAIGTRLERIGLACGEVLRTAAVVGKRFDFSELASVSGRSEDELLDALDEAVAAQLIAAERDESFRFTHDKIREVLYDELNPIRRRRLHGKIACGLEGMRKEGRDVAVEDLAHHFVESGEHERGLQYAEEAAGAARRVFAYHEALEMLERARECAEALERPDAICRVNEASGDVLADRGDEIESASHHERALEAAGDPATRDRLHAKTAEGYVKAGDPRGREHAERALAGLDPAQQPGEVARSMMVQARYHHLAGDLQRAAAIYPEAIAIAESTGDQILLIKSLSYAAGTEQHLAALDASDALARRCIEIGRRERLPVGEIDGHEFLQENAYYRGFWQSCVDHGEQEEQLALEAHSIERQLWAAFRALALHEQGRLDEARRLYRERIQLAQQQRERRISLFLRFGLAGLHVDTGRIDKGVAELESAVRESDEAELLAHRFVGRAWWVRALLAAQRVDEAVREARLAVDLWTANGSEGSALIHATWLAEAIVEAGALDEARAILDRHLPLAERTKADHRVAENLRIRARIDAREGRTDRAVEALDDAVERLDRNGSRLELIRALADRASVHRTRGDGARETADVARAREVVAACGASTVMLRR